METLSFEASILEEAVCSSSDKQARLFCNAKSGRGWVVVGSKRFVGRAYVQAAHSLRAAERLHSKHVDAHSELLELGHHACVRSK